MNNRMIQILLLLLTITVLVLVAFGAPVGLVVLLLLVLLLLLLWWLFGNSSQTEDPAQPDPAYPPEEFYIQDQVIVRGPLSGVTRAINTAGQSVQLRRTNRIAFSELDESVQDCLMGCTPHDFADFVIDLYELSGSEPNVAAAIRAVNNAAGRGSDVQAEPNWLSGYPWNPTGSPWNPTGSPWNPTGSSSTEDHYAPPDLFMAQWAFKEIGLSQTKDLGGGRGVRIGVFDTSPFADSAVTVPQSPSWIDEPNQLTLALANYPTPTPMPDDIDLSSHGLFAAGLAHAVAPNADIQLIRVLGNHNKGDLFTLNLAIFEFIKANTGSQLPEGRIGAAINLSLGIRVPPDEAGFNLPAEVVSLRILLQAAQCAQIMVIAAAGNNSANLSQPEPSNLPANWSEILGVASSTQEQTRSCFSNQGNISAPGGNGRSDDQHQCIPANHICGGEDCPYAIVGPIQKTEDEGNEGYAYWSGTSFAAPLVTGLAALVIEKGNGKLSPQDVRRIIECGATRVADDNLGNRIVHVANTLANFDECAKELGISLNSPTQQTPE